MKKISALNSISLRYFIILGISFFVLLCVLHFASGRALWLDENFILDSLKELKPHQIFGPLKHSQIFPRLYLFAIQKISSIFDYNIFSLRLLPFLFMLFGFYVWLRIYKKKEGIGMGYLLFILSWCGSHLMSYYSAELKQYSMDVFVAALFIYFILNQKNYLKSKKINPWLTAKYLFIPSLILVSYTGYFFILLPLYNLLLSIKYNKRNMFYVYVYLASMLLFLCLSYNFDIKHAAADDISAKYWNDYFISTSSFYTFIKSFGEGLRNLFVKWFDITKITKRIMTLFLPFALYAVARIGVKQIKKDNGLIVSLDSIPFVLIIALFVAGIFKIWPFTGARITLFIAPLIFYAIIKGIQMLKTKIFPVYVTLLGVYIITLLSMSIYLLPTYLFMAK